MNRESAMETETIPEFTAKSAGSVQVDPGDLYLFQFIELKGTPSLRGIQAA